MDRDFYGTAVVNAIERRGVSFLMPQPKGNTVKEAIMRYHEGKRVRAAKVQIKSRKHGKASFYGAIYPKEDCDKDAKIHDRYVAFATNLPKHRIHCTVKSLPEVYKDRWGIETGYRQIEQVRARTRSCSFPLRLFLFYFSAISANMWVQANCIIPGGRKNGLATKMGMVLEDFTRVLSFYIVLNATGIDGIQRLYQRW